MTRLLTHVLIYLLNAIDIMLLIRVITSWVAPGSRFYLMMMTLTEPVIYPMRALFDRFERTRGMIFDLPLLLTWILLDVLTSVLEIAL